MSNTVGRIRRTFGEVLARQELHIVLMVNGAALCDGFEIVAKGRPIGSTQTLEHYCTTCVDRLIRDTRRDS